MENELNMEKNRKRKSIEKNKPFIENEEYMETSDEERK